MRTYDELTPFEREKLINYQLFCLDNNQGIILLIVTSLVFFMMYFYAEINESPLSWVFLIGIIYVFFMIYIQMMKIRKFSKNVFGFAKEQEFFWVTDEELKVKYKDFKKEISDLNKPKEKTL